MLYLYIAIICYLLFVVVFLIDKYILTGTSGNPRLLVFYLGVSGLLGLFLFPLNW